MLSERVNSPSNIASARFGFRNSVVDTGRRFAVSQMNTSSGPVRPDEGASSRFRRWE
jgi:hypothetical protein